MEGLTLSRSMLSRRWRGTIVTSSISQRKATSAGTRPDGRGKAMVSGGRSVAGDGTDSMMSGTELRFGGGAKARQVRRGGERGIWNEPARPRREVPEWWRWGRV